VDPLKYSDWDALVSAHPASSFYHGTAWARVLRDTYGHVPVYLCRVTKGRLEGLLPIIELASRWSGRRGVSLPFIDFCEPLATDDHDREALYASAVETGRERGWRYFESRGGIRAWAGASPSLAFHGHTVDLLADPGSLYTKLSAPVRRSIRKAEREGVRIEFSTSLESVRTFYSLHCLTRRRHGLPPQPVQFFEHIARCLIEPGHGCVAIGTHGDRRVAAAIFFQHGRQALYKYGASDYAFQRLRANDLLMWEAIRWHARRGFDALHLGRTSLANEGLRRFKLGFGAREERIEYARYEFARQSFVKDIDRTEGWFNRLFRWQPLPVLRFLGRVLYPHLA
jgi:CelD/BcsL family acetyltransferase involved in cellulose biosynthesis